MIDWDVFWILTGVQVTSLLVYPEVKKGFSKMRGGTKRRKGF